MNHEVMKHEQLIDLIQWVYFQASIIIDQEDAESMLEEWRKEQKGEPDDIESFGDYWE